MSCVIIANWSAELLYSQERRASTFAVRIGKA